MLAATFQSPDCSRLHALRRSYLPTGNAALVRLGCAPPVEVLGEQLSSVLERSSLQVLMEEYESTFEPSAGAERPPNETAHAPQSPQEGLTRTAELADIAGFYRAFGVEVTPATERVDHITAELDFMHLLAVKQAAAVERGERGHVEICEDAAAAFLYDHLGRWCGRLRDSIAAQSHSRVYKTASALLASYVEVDAQLLPRPRTGAPTTA
jgi:TorA maturation chaperone TorD